MAPIGPPQQAPMVFLGGRLRCFLFVDTIDRISAVGQRHALGDQALRSPNSQVSGNFVRHGCNMKPLSAHPGPAAGPCGDGGQLAPRVATFGPAMKNFLETENYLSLQVSDRSHIL